MGFINEILSADLPTKIIVIGIVLLALLVLFILFAIISNTSAIKKVAKELKKTSKDNKRNTIEAYIRAVRPRGKGVNPLEGIVPTETPAPAPEVVEEVANEEPVEEPAPAPVVPVVYVGIFLGQKGNVVFEKGDTVHCIVSSV